MADSTHFRDRADAGRRLARALRSYADQSVVVYALPRGGVVLGVIVAHTLNAPLDLLIPRKIGHPLNPEYAIAGVSEDGSLVENKAETAAVGPVWLQRTIAAALDEAKRRRQTYLAGRRPMSPKGKIAIVVDDGVATGLTLRAALAQLKKQQPQKIVVAVPVVPADAAQIIQKEADELVALVVTPNYHGAVGAYFDNFSPVEDEQVIDLLGQNKTRNKKAAPVRLIRQIPGK